MTNKVYTTVLMFGSHISNQAAIIRVNKYTVECVQEAAAMPTIPTTEEPRPQLKKTMLS